MYYYVNGPIIILEDIEYRNIKFYERIASFVNTDLEKININDIIYIYFININHYQILT